MQSILACSVNDKTRLLLRLHKVGMVLIMPPRDHKGVSLEVTWIRILNQGTRIWALGMTSYLRLISSLDQMCSSLWESSIFFLINLLCNQSWLKILTIHSTRITWLMDHKVYSHKQDTMIHHKVNLLRAILVWLAAVHCNHRLVIRWTLNLLLRIFL